MKIEMHAHTRESSPCAKINAARVINLYQNAGYEGIVITDHYSKWVMDTSPAATPEEYIEYFLRGYHNALAAAENTGFHVFSGAEVTLLESPNDYLLYGASEDFFYQNPLLFQYSLKGLAALCRQNDILLFQAHPNRSYCSPAPAKFLDGAEIYNGNPRHENRNETATSWAQQNNLLFSSGSDFHEEEDLARGGIETESPATDWYSLKDILTQGRSQLIISETKIV